MSAVSFSGLATGLDTASIVAQLVAIKRQPIVRLQERKSLYESQITALGELKTKLLALKTAAENLDTSTEFSALQATSSNEDLMTVTASSTAAAGSYDIIIDSMATAQKDISQGYDNTLVDVGSGVMSFTIDGETTDLVLAGYTSLEALKNMINEDVAGVGATIIYDGSDTGGYHLVISSTEAGTDSAFTVDVSGLAGGTAPIMANQVPPADAELRIDGLPVTASGNIISDAISGLTLNLLDYDMAEPTIQVNVSTDVEGITENVQALIDAYNDLYGYIRYQDGEAGHLGDSPTMGSVSRRIDSLFNAGLEGGLGNLSYLFQVGITRGDGHLMEFDTDTFAEALADDYGGVRDLFVERGTNLGKSYLLRTTIDDLTDSIDGIFKIGTDALNSKIDSADSSIERYERSVENYQITLERKFMAMESMVASLNAQGSYLASFMMNNNNNSYN